jgi:S-adenosylmethionine:tRNA ribosyltransferase-isomerase
MIPKIRIEDYNYPLPDNRIAKYPLPRRDASKLLRYEDGKVSEYIFRDIPELLPEKRINDFQ